MSYRYDAWGNLVDQGEDSPLQAGLRAMNPFTFVGSYGVLTDTETGLAQMGVRSYDPRLSRFISRDPAEFEPDASSYVYAGDNPLVLADPTGLWPSFIKKAGRKFKKAVTKVTKVARSVGRTAYSAAKKVGHYAWKYKYDIATTAAMFVPGVNVVAGAAKVVRVAQLAKKAYSASKVVRSSKKAYRAVKVSRAAKKYRSASNRVKKAVHKVKKKASSSVKRSYGRVRSTLSKSRACSFTGDTTVLMEDGSRKPIEDVRVGDRVIASDPETGEQAAKEVDHVWVHEDTVIDLVVDGETITTTEDHPFWNASDGQYQRADQLDEGEHVLGADGGLLTVSGLKMDTARSARAYNLSVEGLHTYHVGDRRILVHNKCWINGGSRKADTHVYQGFRNGKDVYAGITRNLERRQAQHGDRFDIAAVTTEPVTRRQARAIEQALIRSNPQYLNKINSISSRRRHYTEALAWGMSWLRRNGR
ncbi:polymorphic toxin-type HINT domain-containing protein [Blastococcus sp. TF02-9]|uniref:polymorphic toxin-type HINT domain-containing protein n=1 Tax=Blastococcus sp. TF02-09 TaxID=2250576 RepID=UPI0013145C01|nr:polymorphic toxin-type HINT domain-containing protein [Blastococcus sp. TF02-9]